MMDRSCSNCASGYYNDEEKAFWCQLYDIITSRYDGANCKKFIPEVEP